MVDYYAILGLRRGASDAEIKRAYRRLARQYHPGINPGDRAAEAMFRRISEAYQTLADPARRLQYDRAGVSEGSPREAGTFEFAGFDFSVTAQGAQAATFTELFADVLHPEAGAPARRTEEGADLHASLTVGFLDAMRGGERQVVVTRQVACEACAGTGQVATPEGRCVHCQSSGRVRWARGHMVFSKTCAACGGSGRQQRQRCAVCGGYGRAVRSEAIPVPVPAGVADGTCMRIPGKGHFGRHGGRTGDLYVTVNVQPHPSFRREGDDLVIAVPIAVHEAVLGARVEVPSLEGTVKVTITPGTQAGQRFRLRNRGVPMPSGSRGDLVVEVRLVLPAVVDERSKELMREFGRLNAEDVRKALIQPS
jgi:molecular chaperone DnaJ